MTRMSDWYGKLRPYTIESVPIEMSKEFKSDLVNAFFDLAEYDHNPLDASVYAEKLLEKYRVLREALEDYIGKWGAVFIRDNNASPKDACCTYATFYTSLMLKAGIIPLPNTMDNACIAWKPSGALALLLSSERIMVLGDPSIIWIRKPTILSHEMRIIIYNGKPRLVSWYYPKVYPRKDPVTIYREKYEPLIKEILGRLGEQNLVLDIGLERYKPVLVEVTPFPPEDNEKRMVGGVDTILFRKDFREKLREAIEEDKIIIRYPTVESTIRETKI